MQAIASTARIERALQRELPFHRTLAERRSVRADAATARTLSQRARAAARLTRARAEQARGGSADACLVARALATVEEGLPRPASEARSVLSRYALPERGRLTRAAPRVRIAAATQQRVAMDHRIFADGAGRSWSVHELDCRSIPGAAGARCLIFDCAAIVRRVWQYPRDWSELDDEGLRTLLDTR